MATQSRSPGNARMSQTPVAVEWVGGAALVIAAWVTGRWQRGLKLMDLQASRKADALAGRDTFEERLLERIKILDQRVSELERLRDEAMQTIADLKVTAEKNRGEIERLTQANLQLQEQLKCPIDECPFVHDGKGR